MLVKTFIAIAQSSQQLRRNLPLTLVLQRGPWHCWVLKNFLDAKYLMIGTSSTVVGRWSLCSFALWIEFELISFIDSITNFAFPNWVFLSPTFLKVCIPARINSNTLDNDECLVKCYMENPVIRRVRRMECPCWYQGTLLWRHNGRDGVSNHHPHEWLLNRSSRRRSKKTLTTLAFVWIPRTNGQ